MTALIVIAKECIAGKVKTRLHPPLTLADAARVAQASLTATLTAVRVLPATRRILYFDGSFSRVPDAAEGYEVIRQPRGTLDERLAHIFDLVDEPAVLIGMDTPQVEASDFAGVFDGWPDGVDAFFGPALDGGFWALGLRSPRGSLVRGIPMSRSDTGVLQRARLERSGLVVRELRTLRDLDTIEDLEAIAGSVSSLHAVSSAQRLAMTAPPGRTLR
ncbi:TIGR04282 family arsenosugar biosynthesis glycosyltransferase [Humibacter albus]|uniref:TIGR04282 family arsenosugar biosynthesis glycosyltransferase n=1 Tax=Humibacter albus TaxID=427754 RepID=UPI0003B475D5|nr:DUF2064 domain-containing protein [Humibacter albus]